MAWFRNHYVCARCSHKWSDAWPCMCDDDCPGCGARHMTPYESDDLTEIIEQRGDSFVVLWSLETAEHDPNYREPGKFKTRKQARAELSRSMLK